MNHINTMEKQGKTMGNTPNSPNPSYRMLLLTYYKGGELI